LEIHAQGPGRLLEIASFLVGHGQVEIADGRRPDGQGLAEKIDGLSYSPKKERADAFAGQAVEVRGPGQDVAVAAQVIGPDRTLGLGHR
jgi:hypothetical protein